ncbi:putative ABC transport system ATP-binding protein/lipoprotein-releasing system ATP-binding protein [Cerasibacillus quisquiliarum]|uniref:Peptide ABC transporter ATP-binding protein n=1 Tax=Cerasibacillus quisquiliarum TaxID=227865 RepID=A0A511UZ57_9BACI|nr:ABC transporter ATP-binding protein [Cerasibacillus quisquiliarum]MBB5147050.1 putative ABC transport system ATP-binding protein/lipoprotein-releasing system ATP-binding protein [Cerasibacillus quisquiliarum]GEN31879.1 peptide ABC transporter ATP-binding protein [Cerasibacillus quisquiliarum]
MVKEIICTNISKTYIGDGVTTHAVKNIHLSFKKGEFTSIIGPSGSGKSTLLSLIGTLDKPSEGQILYDDKDIMKQSKRKIADFRFEKIGFIFQQFHLLPTLTALENVLTPLFGRKVNYSKQKRAKEVLEQVGLINKLNALPSQLSGGQQQRVAIARAIVHKPSWLLADEPTGNLDTETGDKIFSLLKQLNEEEGCSVLYVTHDSTLAHKANRIISMQDGIILEDKEGVAL